MTDTKQPIRVGLIGCGQAVAVSHLPALRRVREIEVVAVADTNPDRLQRVANQFGIAHRYPNYAALLDNRDIEVVGVCVPAEYHVEVGRAVLDAGKHLLIEKPIAVSLSEADRLIAHAAHSAGKVLIGFNLRWHRLAMQARAVLQENRLGPLTLLRAGYTSTHDDIPEWRKHRASGGGVFFEQAVHHFDLWRYLLGAEVEEVFAVSHSGRWEDETASLTARMSNGVLVAAVLAVQTTSTNELEVYGRDGMLGFSFYRFDSLTCTPAASRTDGVGPRLQSLARVIRRAPAGILRLRRGGDFIESYQNEWRHVYDVVRNHVPVACTMDDGRRALQIAFASVKSASSGRPVNVAEVSQ